MKKHHLSTLKAQMNLKRSFFDKVADTISGAFGSMVFFFSQLIFFTVWIALNTGLFPAVPIFDPYPFNFLTMVVSLEAIFLSIFVLISQRRASDIADLREEVTLQLDAKAENEITRILIMLDEIHDKLGLHAEDDSELIRMKKKTNLEAMEKKLLREMRSSNNS